MFFKKSKRNEFSKIIKNIKSKALPLRFSKIETQKGNIHSSQNIHIAEMTSVQKIMHSLGHCLSEKSHLFMEVIEIVSAIAASATYYIPSNVFMLFNNHTNRRGYYFYFPQLLDDRIEPETI